mgnify:FL=1
MIKIDGSYGEGGGQILRTAIGLSVITNESIEIYNIRKNRANPGIKPQHYSSIKIVKKLCNAEVEGLEIGSKKIVFKPGKIKSGKFKFDIGTAGSVTLAFQSIILDCINSNSTNTIRLIGGTDVKWSPSWEFFTNVFLNLLKKMGINIDYNLINRGYYPKGGGEAEIKIEKVEKIKPFIVNSNLDFSKINGLINISKLPDHISKRIKHTIIKHSIKKNLKTSIEIDKKESFSPGVGVTLWSKTDYTALGSAVIGEKGVSSEEVGKKCISRIIDDIISESTVDVYTFDQIIPYMALACKNGVSECYVRKISRHSETNMWLVKKFLDVKFDIKKEEKSYKINVTRS